MVTTYAVSLPIVDDGMIHRQSSTGESCYDSIAKRLHFYSPCHVWLHLGQLFLLLVPRTERRNNAMQSFVFFFNFNSQTLSKKTNKDEKGNFVLFVSMSAELCVGATGLLVVGITTNVLFGWSLSWFMLQLQQPAAAVNNHFTVNKSNRTGSKTKLNNHLSFV